MEQFKTILRYFFGVSFFLSVIGALGNSSYISALCFFCMGFICFPPTLNWLIEKYELQVETKHKYFALLTFYLLGFSTFNKNEAIANLQPPPQPNKLVSNNNSLFTKEEKVIEVPITKAKKGKKVKTVEYESEASGGGCSYNGHTLIVGRRGGCYYINSNGNKTYVDRGNCSGCY